MNNHWYDQVAKTRNVLFVFLTLLGLSIFTLYSSDAIIADITSMETGRVWAATTTSNLTNIVLVHGIWADGSVWSKVIPILLGAGHKVIVAQLPLNSLNEDVAITKRAISLFGEPTFLVAHSYGGEVITNVGYNNSNVTGLIYLAAIAPYEGETATDLFEKLPNFTKFMQDFLKNISFDSAGLAYFNPDHVREWWAHDVDPIQSSILGVIQKPTNLTGTEKSGPPAWKNLPTWYQVSESDHLIPLEIQRTYAERMNATIISLNSSHMSELSHPAEIADFILNATKAG